MYVHTVCVCALCWLVGLWVQMDPSERFCYNPTLRWNPQVEEYFLKVYGADHFARISKALTYEFPSSLFFFSSLLYHLLHSHLLCITTGRLFRRIEVIDSFLGILMSWNPSLLCTNWNDLFTWMLQCSWCWHAVSKCYPWLLTFVMSNISLF